MEGTEYLQNIVIDQKKGIPKGIYSVCSYNRYVIEASFRQAMEDESVVLIESTCNQVNQYGGYTGMKPVDFKRYIFSIAGSMNFPNERIILGGDHLGPYPFQNEKAESAMDKAREMVREYMLTGVSKIHLDASMSLGDDPGGPNSTLDPRIIAERCAELCDMAEKTHGEVGKKNNQLPAPVYVIGTEVPAPGGSDEVEKGLEITGVSDLKETVSLTMELFQKYNLHDAWERVIAVVVQPGVEHGGHTIVEYDREKAKDLTSSLKEFPHLVFEGHATDYQTARGLKEMVEDGIAILKVGPSLTFATREAVFLLNYMEEEIFRGSPHVTLSKFSDTLENAMLENPKHWQKHCQGSEPELQFARKYSFFDRARYYWMDEKVKNSLKVLIENLGSRDIPLSLISQFFPEQYNKIRAGKLQKGPEALIRDRIREILKVYSYAVGNRD